MVVIKVLQNSENQIYYREVVFGAENQLLTCKWA